MTDVTRESLAAALTDEERVALRRLLDGARPAPWVWLDSGGDPGEYDELQDGHGEMVATQFSDDIRLKGEPSEKDGLTTDGRLCAFLRNIAPRLLDLPSLAPEPPPREACGNCGHTRDDHSQRGRELCGIPWCTCPGFLTRAAQPAPDLDVERLGLVLCQQRKHTSYGGRGLARVYPTPPCGGHRNEAAAIAAKYTRLLHARSGRSQEEASEGRSE